MGRPQRRPRADNRGRKRRVGFARDVLRSRGRFARHGAEPYHAVVRAGCDGAARRARLQAIREAKLNVLRALRPLRTRSRQIPVVRARTRRAWSKASRCRRYLEEKGSRRSSRTETYVAFKLCDRQLALGRRAVLSPHWQADAGARKHHLHAVQGGPANPV